MSEHKKLGTSNPKWRTLVSIMCILLAVFALVIGVAARYTRDNFLDTNRYVELVGPLPQDPAVSQALGAYAADQLFNATNAEEEIANFLPPKLSPLAPPLTSELKGRVANLATQVAASDAVADSWTASNRTSHEALMRLAEGPLVDIDDERRANLKLNLENLATQLRNRFNESEPYLSDQQRNNLTELTIGLRQNVSQLRTAVSAVNTGSWLLPLAGLVLLAAGVWVANNRRRALMWAGIGIAAAAASLLLGFRLVSQNILGDIGQAVYQNAANVIYETFYGNLRGRLVALLIIGLAVVLVALALGPSRPAKLLREKTKAAWKKVNPGAKRRRRS